MKKLWPWLIGLSILTLVFSWGLAGVKLLDGDYGITVEMWITMVSWVVLLAAILIKKFQNKCPHCGRLRLTGGEYCSYCGKKIA